MGAYRSWWQAWTGSAYGARGFWTSQQPAGHFRTGAMSGSLVAQAVAGLLSSLARGDRGTDVAQVVDVGAGDGTLLTRLAGLRPDLALAGVDRRPRPADLPDRVRWHQDHHDVRTGRWESGGPGAWLGPAPALVMAHEWLDDLPAPVVQHGPDGWVEVEVDAAGRERAGGPPGAEARAWAARWWPEGRRAELGVTRDVAWSGLVGAALDTGGWALAVDYGHQAGRRPEAGTLAAYAAGRRRPLRPDGTVNLTAHVAVDALAAAGERAGAATLLLDRQRHVLQRWAPPQPEPDPLQDLVGRSERAVLSAAGSAGDLWWLLQGPPGARLVP